VRPSPLGELGIRSLPPFLTTVLGDRRHDSCGITTNTALLIGVPFVVLRRSIPGFDDRYTPP
jgi:hypothetical protein